MSGNLQEVSLRRSASALSSASSETSTGTSRVQVNANVRPASSISQPASDGTTRLLPLQPQLNAPSTSTCTPSQLDKGENSPLLTHYAGAASQSPLPDLLEALQKETEAASQQKLKQYQQHQQQNQQNSETFPEDDWSADQYSSDDEYHSGMEDEEGNEDFARSAVTNIHANTSINMREGRSRTPADQVEHPLRLSSYSTSNSNKEVPDPSLSHADDSFLRLDHPLRNTLITPSPPTSTPSIPTVDGSTTSNTTSSTLQQQHPSTASAAIPNTTTQNHHRRMPRHRSSSTSTSSSTTLRRTRAGSSSNNRLAQQQEQQQEQHQSSSHQHEGQQDLHGQENPSLGLRASLDSGMAALRRWIRTRSAPPNQQSLQQQQQSRSSRNISWHGDNMDLLSTASVGANVSASAPSLGDEDLFYLTMNGDDPRASPAQQQQQQLYHPTIFEEDEDDEDVGRQRSLSEPDALSLRHFLFQRALGIQSRSMRRRRGRSRAESEGTREVSPSMSQGRAPHLSSSAAAALYSPSIARLPEEAVDFTSFRSTGSAPVASARELSATDGGVVGGGLEIITVPENSMVATVDPTRVNASSELVDADSENDPERQARIRWVQINRRFQLVITIVALLFSLLLFAILICWVVLTSAYVVSFDKACDVPLKPYFWLVTLQLVLDVFRSDIMRFIFHWNPSSNERIPCRVIAYNVAYLLYALLVLRLGIRSVFLDNNSTCQSTATELFNSSAVFVSLSLAAWTTILCGYLLPFCVVAALLTYNGYNPSAHINQDEHSAPQAVFPAAYSTTGAPPGCVDRLQLLRMEDFPDNYPGECCICMEDFNQQHLIVETACKHVFHKQCCREWLRTARTCPVCRTDIPATLEDLPEESEGNGGHAHSPRIPIGPTGRPVAGLLRILRRGESSSSVLSNNSAQRVPESASAVSVHSNVP